MKIYLKFKKKIVFCFLLFVVCCGLLVWQGIYFPKDSDSQIEKKILIEKGEGTEEIASKLKEENLIKNRWSFLIYLFLKGDSKKLQAGEYLISPAQTITEIVQIFVSGDVIKEKITIIEGWNLRDIGWYFKSKGMFQAQNFYELKNLNLEGYLFPDTYEIKKAEPLEEIVKKMLDNFNKKLTPELQEEIKNQGKTISEIVIMASLLEKEVKLSADKEIVSGILWKRLKNDIPLQVDATITYITGKRTIKIPKEDLEIDSLYNTYKYKGLPFGPICNPGMESILAAIYPTESDFWYYLSAPEKTIFSKTLEEHNLAKQKYLR